MPVLVASNVPGGQNQRRTRSDVANQPNLQRRGHCIADRSGRSDDLLVDQCGLGASVLSVGICGTSLSRYNVNQIHFHFSDSFATTTNKYRWQEYFELYRGPYVNNQSARLSDSVADYFNGVVLQRLQLGPAGRAGGANMGAVRFQVSTG
jgi:hypothetical protein